MAPLHLEKAVLRVAAMHYNAGVELQEQGRQREAIAEYDEAIRLDPEYTEAYNNRGSAYAGLGQYQRAIQDFDEAIRLNPEYAEAYYNRGLTYKLQGKKSQAIADFEKFITLTDNFEWVQMARQAIEELQAQSE
jgi:tetratricopeptide (TPR) repeat protein